MPTMSSYYEPQSWQAPAARQASWEQPAPPSRSGRIAQFGRSAFGYHKAHIAGCTGSSSVSQREDSPAFSSQFDGMDTISYGSISSLPRPEEARIPLMRSRAFVSTLPVVSGE